MPQKFHYGDGMGTNPIMMMQALSAQVLRYKRIMSDNCVIICSSLCNGFFHDELWPYLREMYDMFQHDYMNTLPDMNRYGEYLQQTKNISENIVLQMHSIHSTALV